MHTTHAVVTDHALRSGHRLHHVVVTDYTLRNGHRPRRANYTSSQTQPFQHTKQTHSHARTLIHTHAPTHWYKHTNARTPTCLLQARLHFSWRVTCTHAHTHSCTLTHTRTHTLMQAHQRTPTCLLQARSHFSWRVTCTHAHTHTHTHAHTHTHTHAHTDASTPTHTHLPVAGQVALFLARHWMIHGRRTAQRACAQRK